MQMIRDQVDELSGWLASRRASVETILTDVFNPPVLSEALESLILLIAPAAPHSADELWESTGRSGFTFTATWPTAVDALAAEDTVTIAVQVNGKLRDTLDAPTGSSDEALRSAALGSAKVQLHLEGKEIRKVIVVPGKLVSIVVG